LIRRWGSDGDNAGKNETPIHVDVLAFHLEWEAVAHIAGRTWRRVNKRTLRLSLRSIPRTLSGSLGEFQPWKLENPGKANYNNVIK
jgi:hypothetical protein